MFNSLVAELFEENQLKGVLYLYKNIKNYSANINEIYIYYSCIRGWFYQVKAIKYANYVMQPRLIDVQILSAIYIVADKSTQNENKHLATPPPSSSMVWNQARTVENSAL